MNLQNPATRRALIGATFALMLLPFLLLSVFAYPTTDDYCFAWSFKNRGFWLHQSFHYLYWSGRYVGNMIMVANPLAFDWWGGHRLTPPLLFLGYAAAAKFFFRELSLRQLSHTTCWALSALFIFTLLVQHPYIPGYFYWYTDTPYTLADISSLLLLVAFVRYETRTGEAHPGAARWVNFAAICLLMLFIMGCNELPLVFVLLHVLALNFFSLLHTRRVRWDYAAMLAVGLVGAGVALLAPGNAVRSNSGLYDAYRRNDLVYTLTQAPPAAVSFILNYLPLVLMASLVLLPVAVRLSRRAVEVPMLNRFFGIPPVYAVLIYFGSLLAAFFPTYYAIGQTPPPMPQCVIYFWLVLGWFWLVFVGVFAWERRAQRQPGRFSPLPVALPNFVVAFLVAYLLLSFGSSFNFRSAYSDLFTGRAYRFDQQMKARIALVRSLPGDTITIPPLQNVPVTIVPPIPARDWVFSHPDDHNTCAGDYFGKKVINIGTPAR